jgi:hypothetical protein
MNTDRDGVTERIIGCAFTVANTLGIGFLEKVYENALAHEMRKRGLLVVQQRGIVVRYDDAVIGEYTADPGQSHLHFRCAQRLVALPKQVFFAADKRR